MAGSENTIKTRLTLDGEKEFKQQINSINRELRLGNAQLKEVAATYDLNGNAQERLSAKSRVLREQLDAQNRIVQEYENRMRQAEAATDLSADGLRNYSIQLTNARTKAKQLEKELNDTDRELEELGRDSRRAGDQLENNLGESAEEVEDKFERMAKGIKESLEDVRGLQSISLGVDLVRGAWDIGENIASFIEQSVGDGMKRAMVSYNITQSGGSLAASMGVANEYAALFQDQDSAYEAVSNIVAAGYKDAELRRMAQYIGGAAIQFQDTLKIESLADSLQETLSTGKLTGQIAELVSRLEAQTGISEEQVNLQLAEARKQDEATGGNEQTRLALEAYLKNAGLAEYYEGFKEQNKELVEAATNLQEFNTALNELSQTTLPLLTPAIEGTAKLFGMLDEPLQTLLKLLMPPNSEDTGGEHAKDEELIIAEYKKLYGDAWETKYNEQLAKEQSEQKAAAEFPTQQIVETIGTAGAVTAKLTGASALKALSSFAPWALGAYVALTPSVAISEEAPTTSRKDLQQQKQMMILTGQTDTQQFAEVDFQLQHLTQETEKTTTTATGLLHDFATKMAESMKAEAERLKYLTEVDIQANYNEGVLETYDAEMGSWTPVEDVQEKVDAAEDTARTGGNKIGASLVEGLDSSTARLRAVAEAQRLTLEDVWADPITPTVVVGYKTAGPVNQTLPEVKVTVNPADVILDNRKVGTIVSGWANSAWGKLINGAKE